MSGAVRIPTNCKSCAHADTSSSWQVCADSPYRGQSMGISGSDTDSAARNLAYNHTDAGLPRPDEIGTA